MSLGGVIDMAGRRHAVDWTGAPMGRPRRPVRSPAHSSAGYSGCSPGSIPGSGDPPRAVRGHPRRPAGPAHSAGRETCAARRAGPR